MIKNLPKKRIVILFILLCVLLSGCGTTSVQECELLAGELLSMTPEEIAKEQEILAQEKAEQELIDGFRYYIKVNYESNCVTVYEKNEEGQYTVPIKSMICSCGTATPTGGVFQLIKQGRWNWLGLQGDVFGQYCTQIKGNILFHSVPYTELYNKGSLQYLEFEKLGTSASHGCVRLQVVDAKWIFDNKEHIEAVEFYADSTPGPLGRPSAPYISYSGNRNWDPTDPDSNNPWKSVTTLYYGW